MWALICHIEELHALADHMTEIAAEPRRVLVLGSLIRLEPEA